jgi:basic membrane protein A
MPHEKEGTTLSQKFGFYGVLLLAGLAVLSLTSPVSAKGEGSGVPRVAFLYIGPIGDFGWTYEGHLGAQSLAKELPFVEVIEKENAYGTDTPRVLREYGEAGCKVVFCHSYNFGKYIGEVAPNYPNVIFMWGAGVEKKALNAGIYFGRMYEARFLAGIVAGGITQTNRIGYAAALPTSEVIRNVDAFARGVSLVNPRAKVYVEWIGEWYDPAKERGVSFSLIDKGCDIITHHSDSCAPAKAAEERGVYYISFGSDMKRFAPHVFLTGTVWNWAPIMIDIVKAVLDGRWNQQPDQDWWYGLSKDVVRLAPFGEMVPYALRQLVETKKQAIIDGKFEVFPGMSDKQLREIQYFESNVVVGVRTYAKY